MDKFLNKIQKDVDEIINPSIKNNAIKKEEFNTVYTQVREKPKKTIKKISKSEKSIYETVIKQFLLENPEFIKEVTT